MSFLGTPNDDIQRQLDLTHQLIMDKVHVRNKAIESAIVNLNQAGGKYLRPAFFFLFASFGDKYENNETKLLEIAASLEILHMATLVHDDIIDDSPLRRGRITIQSQYGKDVAVYTGDLLFTIFFELILSSMNGSSYMSVNAKSMKKILMGELDQMHLRFRQDQSIQDYLRSISGKTAELFKLAAKEGAYFSGADSTIVRLAGKIGFMIGIAFQILDDILDYTADVKDFNKPVLEDIKTGVYTLPLLLAIKNKPDTFRPILDKRDCMTQEDIKKIADLVKYYKGVQESRFLALKFTEKAISCIDQLPKTKEQKLLRKLTVQLLKRKL